MSPFDPPSPPPPPASCEDNPVTTPDPALQELNEPLEQQGT